MKNILSLASVSLLVLSIAILYIGLQFDKLINPPVISGVAFLILAFVLFKLRDKL